MKKKQTREMSKLTTPVPISKDHGFEVSRFFPD
jgi:hypothetical protein